MYNYFEIQIITEATLSYHVENEFNKNVYAWDKQGKYKVIYYLTVADLSLEIKI